MRGGAVTHESTVTFEHHVPRPDHRPTATPRARLPREASSLADGHAHEAHPGPRLHSVDLLRGLVIVLMALDHARDFLGLVRGVDTTQMSWPYFLTRWVTHFCAPTFVFLAGTSVFLSLRRRGSIRAQSAHLVRRGLWLIVAELTIVSFGWFFHTQYPWTGGWGLQVIGVIGVSMIVLAGLVRLPLWVSVVTGLAMAAGHNLLDGIQPAELGPWASLWQVLHVQGPTHIGPIRIFVAYPLVPWIGVMALGYSFGAVLALPSETRRRRSLALGLTAATAFVALRLINVYGDPNPWSAASALGVLSFLDTTKYPPSLLFLLMTLGPAITVLALAERWLGPLARGLSTFGRVPFFFYVVHVYVFHALAVLVGWLQGFPPRAMFDLFLFLPKGYGLPLPVVYAAWIGLVLAHYPLCRWFAGIKARHRWPWLSYL